MSVTIVDFDSEVQLPVELPAPVYGAMLAIWQLRPDMQQKYPLQEMNVTDYHKFLGWCVYHGRNEYKILKQLDTWNDQLTCPAGLPVINGDQYGPMFSVGMYLMGLAKNFDFLWPILFSRRSRRKFWRWYWLYGRIKLEASTAEWQLKLLVRNYNHSIISFLSDLLPTMKTIEIGSNLDELVNDYHLHDIKACFDNSKGGDYHSNNPVSGNNMGSFVLPENSNMARLMAFSYDIVPLFRFRDLRRLASRFARPGQAGDTSGFITSGSKHKKYDHIPTPGRFGVNLIGFARGELGIGEDLRTLAMTFLHAEIPFCILNVTLGERISQKDMSMEKWLSDYPQYGINIFCMTGKEHIYYYLKNGNELFENYYNIGVWPWELSKWPDKWSHAFSLVNEIWGISKFTSRAYEKSDIPVYTMPLPVSVTPVADKSRQDFGLPVKDYLFIFSFDLNSTIARKNPRAVIEAFQLAFPGHDMKENVGLVLKVSHVNNNNQEWNDLRLMIADDSRVILIQDILRKPDLLALYNCCNCFVSLHRSEGFGRNLVESLMLGLDVIATAYSGNEDYLHAAKIHAVDYTLHKVNDGEYFDVEGQYWAEPSIATAAKLMKKLAKSSSVETLNTGKFEDYSPDTISYVYRDRLENIFKKLNTKK